MRPGRVLLMVVTFALTLWCARNAAFAFDAYLSSGRGVDLMGAVLLTGVALAGMFLTLEWTDRLEGPR